MAQKTGRPPKNKTKNINLGLRISEETDKKLKECAKKLNVSRTFIIEKGIDLVENEIKKSNL